MERGVIRITDEHMTLIFDGHVIAHAYMSQDAWIVSSYPERMFTRNQAITALSLCERITAGYPDDDVFVMGWRSELCLGRGM